MILRLLSITKFHLSRKLKKKLGEDGNPVLDEDGNPVFETDEEGNVVYEKMQMVTLFTKMLKKK